MSEGAWKHIQHVGPHIFTFTITTIHQGSIEDHWPRDLHDSAERRSTKRNPNPGPGIFSTITDFHSSSEQFDSKAQQIFLSKGAGTGAWGPGNGDREMGTWKRGPGNGDREMGTGKWGPGNGDQGRGSIPLKGATFISYVNASIYKQTLD